MIDLCSLAGRQNEVIALMAAAGLSAPYVVSMLRSIGEGLTRKLPVRPGEEVPSEEEETGDQLEGVEGIGPAIGAFLRTQGIRNLATLSVTTPDQLRCMLTGHPDFHAAEPCTWPVQAALLDRGRFDEFLRLAIILRAGAPKLEDIDGIGPGRAKQLRDNGIQSPTGFVHAGQGHIRRIFPSTRSLPDTVLAASMAHARRLYDGEDAVILALAGLPPLQDLQAVGANKKNFAILELVEKAKDKIALDPAVLPGLLDRIAAHANADREISRWGFSPGIRLLSCAVAAVACFYAYEAAAESRWFAKTACDLPPIQMPRGTMLDTNVVTLSGFSSGAPKTEAEQLIDDQQSTLKAMLDPVFGSSALPEIAARAHIVLIGHADKMRHRSEGDNYGLSRRRANAVKSALLDNRNHWALQADDITIVAAGDGTPTQPAQNCNPPPLVAPSGSCGKLLCAGSSRRNHRRFRAGRVTGRTGAKRRRSHAVQRPSAY